MFIKTAGDQPRMTPVQRRKALASKPGRDLQHKVVIYGSRGSPLTQCPAAFLALVAALASYLPALRAMRVDPVVALRIE